MSNINLTRLPLLLIAIFILAGGIFVIYWDPEDADTDQHSRPEGCITLHHALNKVVSDMEKAHDDATSDPPTGCEHNVQVLSHFHDDDGTAIWPCTKCDKLLRWDSELEMFVPSNKAEPAKTEQ